MNRITHLIFGFNLLFLLLWCSGCERSKKPYEPNQNVTFPIANAGPDKHCRVGQYVSLGGGGNRVPQGHRIVWYEWEQEPTNPDTLFVKSGDTDSTIYLGFVREGIYKFTLTVKSLPDSLDDLDLSTPSEPDEVVVTVDVRDQIIFEDPSLEIHIRWSLKMHTGRFSETDLTKVDSVRCAYIQVDKVKSISGLERCINLQCMFMARQRIKSLEPLSELIQLRKLCLSQNYYIDDISPLSELINLRYLDLDTDDVTDISPLASLTQLTYLNLMYNPINEITVLENMTLMEQLLLSNTPIRDISSLAELKEIFRLYLPDCELTDITPLANLTNLRLLYLKYNNITDISPLSKCVKLERLYLDKNEIKDISALENITECHLFDLGRNQIRNILPLVNNNGLGAGDLVDLKSNPLDEISINEYIPALKNRGVIVLWD